MTCGSKCSLLGVALDLERSKEESFGEEIKDCFVAAGLFIFYYYYYFFLWALFQIGLLLKFTDPCYCCGNATV